MQDEYVSTEKAKELLQVSLKTITRWDKSGKIRVVRTPSGRRRINLTDIHHILGWNSNIENKEKICYCRVSSRKQMDDLDRQKDFFQSKFPNHKLVTDVGSGLNWKRKGLKTILERAMRGDISEVVVAHRDRLCRFAFELVEWILSTNGVKIVVLNNEKTEDAELSDDIMSIIHVYSCRKMGTRRYNNKENTIISNTGTKKEHDSMDRK